LAGLCSDFKMLRAFSGALMVVPTMTNRDDIASGRRFLTRPEVCERVRLSYSTVWRMERAGEFPARRRLSKGRVAWFAEEVERWIQERERVEAPG
jgi:prophage regulatory protein